MAAPVDVASQVTDRIVESSFMSPVTLVKAPPGAGKSYLVALIAGAHAAGNEERVAVATPTRAQGADVAADVSAAYGQVQVCWHAPKDKPHSSEAVAHVPKPADLPEDEHVAVGTLAKWANYPVPGEGEPYPYDLLIVDEVYQATTAALTAVAHVAPRIVAVGDPGQIAPVVTVNLPEYGGRFASPAAPASEVLLAHPEAQVFELPATRRFGAETARLVSEAFYDFEWGSIAPARTLTIAGRPVPEYGASVLPGVGEGRVRADRELAQHLAALAGLALSEGLILEDGAERPVKSVFIVCAHIDQVTAARAAVAHLGEQVVVDTAERLQGRQADVALVWHPATTGPAVTDFQRDTGRLCVMLSRHRAAVILVAYEDVLERLSTYNSPGRRVTGEDSSWQSYTGALAATKELLNHHVNL